MPKPARRGRARSPALRRWSDLGDLRPPRVQYRHSRGGASPSTRRSITQLSAGAACVVDLCLAGRNALTIGVAVERTPSLGARLLEVPRDLGPVDHVPPRLDVVGPAVLVFEVVGVLPDVDPEERGLAIGDR